MKYVVQENASFIANGRIYKPGDEIDSDYFKFKKTLEAAILAGKLKPVQDTAGGGDNAGDGNDAGGENTPITPKKRKAMEKAVIDNGLRNLEEIKNLSDKDLADLLMVAGVEV
jgi:hypothetical protein